MSTARTYTSRDLLCPDAVNNEEGGREKLQTSKEADANPRWERRVGMAGSHGSSSPATFLKVECLRFSLPHCRVSFRAAQPPLKGAVINRTSSEQQGPSPAVTHRRTSAMLLMSVYDQISPVGSPLPRVIDAVLKSSRSAFPRETADCAFKTRSVCETDESALQRAAKQMLFPSC